MTEIPKLNPDQHHEARALLQQVRADYEKVVLKMKSELWYQAQLCHQVFLKATENKQPFKISAEMQKALGRIGWQLRDLKRQLTKIGKRHQIMINNLPTKVQNLINSFHTQINELVIPKEKTFNNSLPYLEQIMAAKQTLDQILTTDAD